MVINSVVHFHNNWTNETLSYLDHGTDTSRIIYGLLGCVVAVVSTWNVYFFLYGYNGPKYKTLYLIYGCMAWGDLCLAFLLITNLTWQPFASGGAGREVRRAGGDDRQPLPLRHICTVIGFLTSIVYTSVNCWMLLLAVIDRFVAITMFRRAWTRKRLVTEHRVLLLITSCVLYTTCIYSVNFHTFGFRPSIGLCYYNYQVNLGDEAVTFGVQVALTWGLLSIALLMFLYRIYDAYKLLKDCTTMHEVVLAKIAQKNVRAMRSLVPIVGIVYTCWLQSFIFNVYLYRFEGTAVQPKRDDEESLPEVLSVAASFLSAAVKTPIFLATDKIYRHHVTEVAGKLLAKCRHAPQPTDDTSCSAQPETSCRHVVIAQTLPVKEALL